MSTIPISDYQRLLDAVLKFAQRENLTAEEQAVMDAYQGAEPYEKCLELLQQAEAAR